MSAVLTVENDVDTTNASAQSMTLFLDMELTESGHRVLTKNSEDKLIAFLASDHKGKIVNPYHVATEMAIDHHSGTFVNALRQLGKFRMANHRQYLDYVAGMAKTECQAETENSLNGLPVDKIISILKNDANFQSLISSNRHPGFSDDMVEKIVSSVGQMVISSLGNMKPGFDSAEVDIEMASQEAAEPEDAVGLQPNADEANDAQADDGTSDDAEEPTDPKQAAANQSNNSGNTPLRRRNNH